MNFQNQVDWGQLNGVDVLAGVKAPEPLSLETLKGFIMMRCGLLTPLYSEPETMASAIALWFNVNAYGISKMLDLASTEYLPLENYRRVESGNATRGEVETIGRKLDRENGETETTADDGSITDRYENHNEKTVSAYNETTYSPDEKNDSSGNNVRTIDTDRVRTMTGTQNDVENTTRNHNETSKDDRLVYGNIGTMTAQDMFNQELDLLARFNPYDWIVARMENDLFLSLW